MGRSEGGAAVIDKAEFYKRLDSIMNEFGIADHFFCGFDLEGVKLRSVRLGAGGSPSEANYERRENLLGVIEDTKIQMYTSRNPSIKAPKNLIGCPHGTPEGDFCPDCSNSGGFNEPI